MRKHTTKTLQQKTVARKPSTKNPKQKTIMRKHTTKTPQQKIVTRNLPTKNPQQKTIMQKHTTKTPQQKTVARNLSTKNPKQKTIIQNPPTKNIQQKTPAPIRMSFILGKTNFMKNAGHIHRRTYAAPGITTDDLSLKMTVYSSGRVISGPLP